VPTRPALALGVRAFWAKMSRITAVRSIAVPEIFSRLRCWAGEVARRQRRSRREQSHEFLNLAEQNSRIGESRR